MLETAAQRAAGHAGLEAMADWRVPNLSYTRRLQALFDHLRIGSVIDVGANAGQFRDQLRHEVEFTGFIYSFEPDPVLAAALMQRAAADPAWTVFPVALGARSGAMPFNIMKNPMYNSFFAPSVPALSVYASGSDPVSNGNVVARSVEVEVRTLDAMAGMLPDLGHIYLKIDTQGFDLEVLEGRREVIAQVPALQTEVSLRPLYLGSPSMETSVAAFGARGFAIADLFLVAANHEHRAVEFDCLMVRAKPAA